MMGRRFVLLLGLLLGGCLLALSQGGPVAVPPGPGPGPGPAVAPVAPTDLPDEMPEPAKPTEVSVLYNGEEELAQLTMGDWGFIPRYNPAEKPFIPVKMGRRSYAVNVVSVGRYQGARFDLKQPLDSEQVLGVKHSYLELYIRADNRYPTTGTGTGTPGTGTTPGTTAPPYGGPTPTDAYGNPIPPNPDGTLPGPGVMPPDPMQPGWQPQPGQPGQPGVPYPPGTDPRTVVKQPLVPAPKLDNLRITFFTEKGTVVVDVPKAQFFPMTEVNRQWLRIGIPLFNLKVEQPFGGKLTRMVVSTDTPANFLLGRIAFVQDAAPLIVQTTVYPPFLVAGERTFFIARVKPVLARYETTWDFDKEAGPSVDARGDRVTFTFEKEGVYLLSCTVRDLNGGKETLTSEIKLKVIAAPE